MPNWEKVPSVKTSQPIILTGFCTTLAFDYDASVSVGFSSRFISNTQIDFSVIASCKGNVSCT